MIAVLLSFSDTANGKSTSAASVAFFFTYMLIFGASVKCIPWVYVPEILPLHVRSKGAAIGTSANALWNFFVVMITPVITETANLTLEEMDQLFTRGDDDLRADKKKLGRSTAVVRSLDRGGAWRKRGSVTGMNGLDGKADFDAEHVEKAL
ncbi:MAG: hypothetical protein Q9194_007138 [Teloschistes cf. exilis]